MIAAVLTSWQLPSSGLRILNCRVLITQFYLAEIAEIAVADTVNMAQDNVQAC
jgi:hypothetical protein